MFVKKTMKKVGSNNKFHHHSSQHSAILSMLGKVAPSQQDEHKLANMSSSNQSEIFNQSLRTSPVREDTEAYQTLKMVSSRIQNDDGGEE